jgi:hypothetical protein
MYIPYETGIIPPSVAEHYMIQVFDRLVPSHVTTTLTWG